MATVQIGGPVCFRNQLFARAPATRRSRSVDDALVRLASRLFGLSAHGNGTALFRHGWNKRQADFGAAALTRSRGAQSDQQRTRQHAAFSSCLHRAPATRSGSTGAALPRLSRISLWYEAKHCAPAHELSGHGANTKRTRDKPRARTTQAQSKNRASTEQAHSKNK